MAQQQDNGPIKPPQQPAGAPPQAPAQPDSQQKDQNGQDKRPIQNQPGYSVSVESNLVNVDAVVTDNDGNIITGLKKENFRVLDDGAAAADHQFRAKRRAADHGDPDGVQPAWLWLVRL